MPALTKQTQLLFDKICSLDCIKEYTLVDGTALALQLKTRLSEDLDFMQWNKTKRDVNWNAIKNELERIATVQSIDILDFYHVIFNVDNVKMSFYITDKKSPVENAIHFKNNLKIADLNAIAAMKMEVMLRRSTFRDYYDIYSLLMNGVTLKKAVDSALSYSNHQLKTKNILALLTNHERFKTDKDFELLEPVYTVAPEEIANYIKQKILLEFS